VLDVTLIGVKKLPKQAQREIEQLRQEVERWRSKALAAAGVDLGSTNVLVSGSFVDPDSGLPPNSRVIFRVGDSQIEVHHERDGITIRARDGFLVMHPVVANVIHIKLEGRL
jgi:hypothetical protein